jgi:hypothetical protein
LSLPNQAQTKKRYGERIAIFPKIGILFEQAVAFETIKLTELIIVGSPSYESGVHARTVHPYGGTPRNACRRVMQAFGIPRLDPGAEGIHLVWSWPDVLPLSVSGYDIQRLEDRKQEWVARCETIDIGAIDLLRRRGEIPELLGPLRLRTGAKFKSFAAAIAGSAPTAMLSAPSLSAASVATEFETFVQELDVPVSRASVDAQARLALAIALANGKSVAVSLGAPGGSQMLLQAPVIDTIVVYTLAVSELRICVYDQGKDTDALWKSAPYIAKNLTLPIRETDLALATPADEYARAKSRLVGGESLVQNDFNRMATTMRAPASAASGRSGETISLMRSDVAQSYEELPFDVQLGALSLHPKTRRMLGFGFADQKKLVNGTAYMYRITGRFDRADLTDTIYDVHRVPASTLLPAAVAIRDITLRFQTPVKVMLDPVPSSSALHAASRRGIRIDTTGYDRSWLIPSYDVWSAIIGFPAPVSIVVLEVSEGNSFSYAGGLPWAFGAPPLTPLPAGSRIELTFGSPILELRLAGTGTLYAIRLPSGAAGIEEIHTYVGPVVFTAQPLPVPPLSFTIANLQQLPVTLMGPIDESTPVPPRPPVGFRLTWLPSIAGGFGAWPDDLDAGPPLDAIAYVIDHRRVELPATYGPWEPISGDDNLTMGSRDLTPPTVRLEYGCDLDALFPAVRPRTPGAGLTLRASDVFGEKDPTTNVVRPLEPFGSHHQYQIRAFDAVGRISATAMLSNVERLEKHVPPPMPVGPQPPPQLDENGRLSGPTGPRARAIVRDAPGLTAADIALLGGHGNAIVLEWGWRAQERDLDPSMSEFRVYVTQPPDVVRATITSVSSAAPNWQLSMTTNLPLVADELAGQWLDSNGYTFRIAQNDAGTAPTMRVQVSVLQPATQPATGNVTLGRPLRPEHQRPRGWDSRVAIVPLTASDTYRYVFYDILTLDASHPRDAVWVGVSAADAQDYVADERTAGANANRAGNESGIAACTVISRYRGQPVFDVPPPLGDVPEIVTDEPSGRQILVDLDLTAMLGGALAPGSPVALERCSADDILSRVSVAGNDVVLKHPDGGNETIAFPNPDDHATVIATLNAHPERLANRYLLHLIVASSDAKPFFARISADIVPVGPVRDRLAPKPGRFFYFLRAADAQGHLSEGGALLPVVVRIPSLAGAARPQRRALSTTDTSIALTVAIPADPDTTHVLLFAAFSPPNTNPAPQPDAQLLRIPNRRDLYPHDGLRLRCADGTLLSPIVVKALGDIDVTTELDGTRVTTMTASATPESWATVWCFALTRDGLPSFGCGPFGTGVRV